MNSDLFPAENFRRPITEADLGAAKVLSVPFKDANGRDSNFVLPRPLNEVLDATGDARKARIDASLAPASPKAGENQWVFSLGGHPRAFLRVQYYVQPIAEDQGPHDGPYLWGKVIAKESKYLIEVCEGAWAAIAEYDNWASLPLSLRRIEESGRPNYKALGWSEQDIKAWLASDEE